jgi:Ca2+-binding EF-hand superfamily protein
MSEDFDPYFKWLGIPPEQQPPNHYRLLGLPEFTDDADVVSHAVDRLMAHLRTFQSGPNSAHSQKLLNEISGARVCLLNADSKAEYDHQLRLEMHAQQQAADISAEVPDSSPTPPSSSPETSTEMDALPTTPQIRTKSAAVASAKYRRQRRKKKTSPVVFVLVLMVAVSLLGIVLFMVLSDNGATPQGGQPTGTGSAASAHAQKKKLADFDQNSDGKVTMQEFLAAHGRDFASRDKDKDDVLSDTEFPPNLVTLLDKNGDGKLNRQEYNARIEGFFAPMDKNNDGVLTAEEM